MPPKTHEIEDRITKASEAMDNDPTLRGIAAAARFGAPYQRLMARRRGRPASHTRGGHNKKLSEPQDSALKDYIFMLYASGHSANLEAIQTSASRLVYYETGDAKSSVSRRWTKAWIARNNDFLKGLKERPMSAKRLSTHIVDDINKHFADFARCMAHWKAKPEDVSNFDESGFQIGVVKGDKVYVPLDCEIVYNADPQNRELVTVVATINYGGKRVPAMIIFKGAHHLRGHFQKELEGGILFARSPTGFTNDRLGLKYLQHFHKYCPPSRPGAYRILIFDGHGSHLSNAFLNFCWEHRIRPFRLPPHTTHLLQPLDVVVFQSLKHWFQKELRREVFNGAEEFKKTDFFAIFQRFWDKVFKSRRIAVSSFQKTGLIPLDPLRVLEKMKEYKEL